MAKYDAQFKLKLVQEYLTGTPGYKTIAARNGIRAQPLQMWIRLYLQHGYKGLSPKHSNYSPQFKMQVIQHMLRENLSCKQVAALYNIRNAARIRVWQNLLEAGGQQALAPRNKGGAVTMRKVIKPDNRPASEKTLEQLQLENEYLRTEVAYLKKLQEIQQKNKAAQIKHKPSTR